MSILERGEVRRLLLAVLICAVPTLPTPGAGADEAAAAPDAPPADELRAAWADTWHEGLLGAAQVTELVSTLAGAHYNAVIAEVRKCGDAYYDSAHEPRATNISDPLPFDPLADLVAKAHAAGLEAHAWIVTYRIWSASWPDPPPYHVWARHPEWAMEDSSGNRLDGNYYNLDPGVPAVQDYIAGLVVDIVSKYDVDGINFDYIRYPSGYYWGYNAITRQRFLDEHGFWPPTSTSDPSWELWADYRRRQVSDLVKRCYLETMALDPGVVLSVDTVGWMGADPNVDYTQTRQYREVLQDARGWMQDHLVDLNVLMNYKREHDGVQADDYRLWADFLAATAVTTGRHGAVGQGAYLNAIPGSVAQMEYARAAGAQGGATYSYQINNKDGLPKEDLYDELARGLYKHAVLPPAMPWKEAPTMGILWGRVTAPSEPEDPIYRSWVYRAQVAAVGPVGEGTESDATGTYGLFDLPPGTYDLTCAEPGGPALTVEGVEVPAGGVVRVDFDLSDVDGDRVASSEDCDDGDATVYPGAPEICDLQDNDCDGTVDEGYVTPGAVDGLVLDADDVTLRWRASPDAHRYDVVKGDLQTLHLSAGDYAAALGGCLEDDGTDLSAGDATAPGAGEGAFYLVRAETDCRSGTYDTGLPSQIAGRDAGVGASGQACP